METKFNFKSQVCTTREQSERLLGLGLKKETADMSYTAIVVNHKVDYRLDCSTPKNIDIPAWSMHRLIEMIDNECVIHLDNFTITGRIFEVYNNLYDNIISCIEWFIKEGYFNKAYLEE